MRSFGQTLTFIFLLSVFLTRAQSFSSEVYHDGLIVFAEKDTLKGRIKYDLEANVVSIIAQEKAKYFSSHKVFFFEIEDSLLGAYRQFYSLPFLVSPNYKIPIFFELIYEGKTSLLRREQIVVQSVNLSSGYWGGTRFRNSLKYSYYLLDYNGDIAFFTRKKKDLYRYFSKKATHVRKFIKENRLNMEKTSDLVQIMDFYNSIN